MSRAFITVCIVALLGLMAGCGSTPVRDTAAERVADPVRVAQYNLEMQRRAAIEAVARRRGIIIIWANSPIRPSAVERNES